MKLALPAIALLVATPFATIQAQDFETKSIRYEQDGTSFESHIIYQPGSESSDKPGILMIPNWMGPTEAATEKAKLMAGDDYIVMVVDMYGVDTRPSDAQEAGKAAGAVRADRDLMRARAKIALAQFKEEGADLGLDPSKIAAIGFCFGGGTALELGRSGAELDAIVSFHGDLLSPTLESDARKTSAKVLVLHGADDPYVPQADVGTFIATMRDTDVDWQLVQYSGAVHSFTDPGANSDAARYDPEVARRAFTAMRALFDEIWRD